MRFWTASRVATMRDMRERGASWGLVASSMGRTIEACRTALRDHHDAPADALERILFVPDTHTPYHDVDAWALMLRAARAFGPTRIVVLGDLVDFFAISSHPKDPNRQRNLESEIQAGQDRLDELGALGALTKNYVAGNHEHRLSRYLTQAAPEIFNLLKFEEVLGLAARGWTYTPYRDHLTIGRLHVTHETGDAGMYAHVRARAAFASNAVIGHTHRMAMHYAGNAHGTSHVGAMFGWLGDAKATDYMHRIKAHAWQLGFGLGYHDTASGVVHLQAVPIIDGACLVEGTLIR